MTWLAMQWTPAVRYIRFSAGALGVLSAILAAWVVMVTGLTLLVFLASLLGFLLGLYFGTIEGRQVGDALASRAEVRRGWRDPSLGWFAAGIGPLVLALIAVLLGSGGYVDRATAAEMGLACMVFLGWSLTLEAAARGARLRDFEGASGKRVEFRNGFTRSSIREYRAH